MRNITIDDSGNRTAIAFSPPTCNGTGWAVNSGRGYGGSYTSCSSAVQPRAIFNFTGVAIYYLCPNFTGNFMQFELDGVPSGDVNLTRLEGSEDSPDPEVFWFKTDLENKEHTLELLPGSHNSTVFVDAFIYTSLDDADVPPVTSTSSKVAAATTQQAAVATSSAQNRISIGLGVPFGVIILTIFFGIIWVLRKNMRSQSARYSWRVTVPPLPRDPPTSFEAGYTQSSMHTTHSHKMGEALSPNLRPLPTIPASVTSHYDNGEEARMYGTPSPGPSIQQPHTLPTRDRTGSPEISRNDTILSTSTRLEPNRRKVASPPPHHSGNKGST